MGVLVLYIYVRCLFICGVPDVDDIKHDETNTDYTNYNLNVKESLRYCRTWELNVLKWLQTNS